MEETTLFDTRPAAATPLEHDVRLPAVLDACCGSRMFWFDKNDPRALFVDNRCEVWITDSRPGASPTVIKPDVLADFVRLPFPSESFALVVFDPPHFIRNSASGWNRQKYGFLSGSWRMMLRNGFAECFRVLKPQGTLIFKWAESSVPLSEILKLTPVKPLFGHRSGKQATTHWVAFLKGEEAQRFGSAGRPLSRNNGGNMETNEQTASGGSAATDCSAAVWQAAGFPSMPGDTQGSCRLCGNAGTGLAFRAWVKDSFTNFDLLRPGEIICHACLFCAEERSATLQIKTGRDKPQKMRTYSHFVVDGQWFALTKADKAKMRELLARQPQVAIIAESGQKHLIFRARPGWWQFEELALLPCWDKVAEVLPVIEEMMTGFSKTEIESGHYQQYRIIKFGIERWRMLDNQIASYRLAAHFQIALFLAQRSDDAA